MGRVVDVFADVACPFTHVSLRLITTARDGAGSDTRFRVRSWPLSLTGPGIAPKVVALQEGVAPDLFAGFNAGRFPASTRAALAAEQAAYRQSIEAGERFSLLVRDALFERGLDVSDPEVLASLGAPAGEEAAVDADRAEGERRGVRGSPHYFAPGGEDFFCPLLDIGAEVRFDREGFERFTAAVL